VLLCGAWPLAEVLEVVELAVVCGELLRSEGGSQGVDRLVQHGPAPLEVDAERLELLPHMSGPDPEDQTAARQVIEGGVLLGREEWMPQPHDGDVTEQPYPLGGRREEGEGGDGVVPDRAHRGREAARDGDVVAAREVGEAGAVGGAGDLDEVAGARTGLPLFRVDRALRLDGKLHPVQQPGPFGVQRLPFHSPSSVSPSSSMALRRTIRSTTSASRCPICASPTSRDLGQVESECG
jgi:hypothetical protein